MSIQVQLTLVYNFLAMIYGDNMSLHDPLHALVLGAPPPLARGLG